MDEQQLGSDFYVEMGRVVIGVYLGASLAALFVYLVGDLPIDRWALVQIGVGPVAAVVTWRLPWARSGPALTRLSLVVGTLVTLALTPIFVRDPGMLALPILAATLCGLSLPWPWLFAYQIPVSVALGAALAVDRSDVRSAVATSTYLTALSLGTGGLGLWIRSRIARADAETRRAREAETERMHEHASAQESEARRAAREAEQRAALGRSLQAKVERVANGSQAIDRQSDRITAAIEELAVSLRETAVASEQTATSVEEIATAARHGDSQVAELGRAGQEIVGIVDTITELSEQTNLLALNASIESARAGDAGKGFAVVANEVKELAQQTAKSAANIARVVDDVQRRVAESSDAMSTITEMVGGLDQAQTMLKHLVLAQSGTVEEITEAVVSEAEGIAAITVAIDEIDREASDLSRDTAPPPDPAPVTATARGRAVGAT